MHFENEGKSFNYSIVNGQAPTETSDDNEEKDGFFNVLERSCDTNPTSNIKIDLGDFSAQVGKEAISFPTCGKYSLHNVTNNN